MDLTELGLTKNEAKAYETLLKLGKTSAAHISKESRVPYGRIYDVLGSLEEKGLVKTIPEPTRMYFPSDPKALEEYVAKKKAALEEIESKVKEFKSIYKQHGEEQIQIVKGERNFKKLALAMKKPEKYEYSVKLAFRKDPEFVREVKAMRRKRIKHLTLGRYDSETKKNYEFWKKIEPNTKPIPNEGVAMSLIDGEELLLVMAQSNTIMLIKDKGFIKFMETLFLNYYEKN